MKIFLIAVFILVVVLVGLAILLYTPDKSAASLREKYDDAATSYIEVAGIRLRVRDTGPRGAPAVILLHGFGASLDTWEPWALVLSKHYRVVRFDLPGFGLTGPDPARDYSDQRTVVILAALMDRLGVAKASLIGNSLGGKIAWNFAVDEPTRVETLVLISPDGFASPGFEYGKKPQLPAVLKLLPYTMPKFMLRMNLAVAYADPKHLSDAVLTRYADMMRAPGDRGAMLDRMGQVMLQDPAPLLRRITAPTLLLWGEKDGMIPFSNAEDYLRDIPGSKLVALPDLGHVPFEEEPETSLRPVVAFLAADGNYSSRSNSSSSPNSSSQ
jgi:pimeloyl-ACP methyl ester carboxylesterase